MASEGQSNFGPGFKSPMMGIETLRLHWLFIQFQNCAAYRRGVVFLQTTILQNLSFVLFRNYVFNSVTHVCRGE